MSDKTTFWKTTRFLWIGGIIGIVQQLLGRVDYYLYRGHDIFSISAIMGSLSFYAVIILFVMKRDAAPKYQFRDLFLFFLGLDFFYYLYVFFVDLIRYVRIEDHSEPLLYYFQSSVGEVVDFIKWTIIGTAAGLWVLAATVCRNKGKRVLFGIMAAVLFGVILFELTLASDAMYHFLVQEYNRAHQIALPENVFYSCPIAQLLTALGALCVSGYLYFIRKLRVLRKRDSARESES